MVYAVTTPKLLPPPLREAKRSALYQYVLGLCSKRRFFTGILLRIGIDHRTIGQDNLEVHDIVGCPAVLSAEETHSTWMLSALVINNSFQDQHTSKHVPSNSHASKSTSNHSPTSPIKSLLSLFPRQTRSNDRRLVIWVIENLIQILSRN